MNKQTATQTHTLQLLETGELVNADESHQPEAAQAYFRRRLLGYMGELQVDSLVITQSASAASGRSKS
jgi:hypothetical protein